MPRGQSEHCCFMCFMVELWHFFEFLEFKGIMLVYGLRSRSIDVRNVIFESFLSHDKGPISSLGLPPYSLPVNISLVRNSPSIPPFPIQLSFRTFPLGSSCRWRRRRGCIFRLDRRVNRRYLLYQRSRGDRRRLRRDVDHQGSLRGRELIG